MIDGIPLFEQLEIETRSSCNRACPGCLRNSYPDRAATAPWFEPHQLPTEVIERLFTEALALGFRGPVCLQHYNEPLEDSRISSLARRARTVGLPFVFICTNGDLVTSERAKELDGAFDQIVVALYIDEPAHSRRRAWIERQFKRTVLQFTAGTHMPTHFSPLFDVRSLAARHVERPCSEPRKRMIVNHRGEMLLCCDDMVGQFRLGSVYERSLGALWYSEEHQHLVRRLEMPGGRSVHPHCQSCPRP